MVDAQNFFLTYPRFKADIQELYEFFCTFGTVIYARICEEAHEDGCPHMHACVMYDKRIRGDNRKFDFQGRYAFVKYHPNIQKCRNIDNVLEYIAKHGNYEDYGEKPVTSPTVQKFAAETMFDLARGCRENYDAYCLEHRVSIQWADRIWNERAKRESDITEASGGSECLYLQLLSFTGEVHLIIGPSGCGKTSWATRVCPKPALLVSHMDDLKKLRKDHKCIVFDDVDFKHWPSRAQIHILDWHLPRTINVKHGAIEIPKHMPKIFTCNYIPFEDLPEIKRRYHLTDLFAMGVEWVG